MVKQYYFSFCKDDDIEHNDKYPTYSDLQIKWPKDLGDFSCSEEVKENSENEFTRPDSGVGESVIVI